MTHSISLVEEQHRWNNTLNLHTCNHLSGFTSLWFTRLLQWYSSFYWSDAIPHAKTANNGCAKDNCLCNNF